MSSNSFKPLQGMSDIGAAEIDVWHRIEDVARSIFARYNFSEVRTPIIERTRVFTRSIGDETDIVQKEMYTFEDRGGRSLTLRPEGTAGVVRHLASIGQDAQSARVYYIGPMFRAERPQAGRRRQFHQCGVEMVGEPNPLTDAECIALQLHLLEEWGVEGCQLQINTRGSLDEAEHVASELRAALEPMRDRLCENCLRRLETNVLRVLDCKNEVCSSVVESLPAITDFMREESRGYFEQVIEKLNILGVNPQVSPRLVRGLDYYHHTVWEITHSALGAQDAIAGGGRYSIDVGKTSIDGVGFAMGIERVIMAMEALGVVADIPAPSLKLWMVSMGEAALAENFALAQSLRRDGVSCGMDLEGRSMKAQMRSANRAQAEYVLIRGQDEIEKGIVLLKNMDSGEQEEVALDLVQQSLR